MANYAVLTDMHIATDTCCTYDTLLINVDVVADFHLDVLQLTVFLVKSWPKNHIFLDDDILSEMEGRHVTPDEHS